MIDKIQDFRGQKLLDVRLKIEAILGPNSKIRIIEPGGIYTMEYRPNRINIHIDNLGYITKIVNG